jgi:hypothetical protein
VRARANCCSWALIVMTRPVAQVVHWAANGQAAQAGPNAALPPPRLADRIATLTRPGQVTVLVVRSMSKRSLANRPPGAVGGCTLVIIRAPAVSRMASSLPVP